MTTHNRGRVSPFGHPRINALLATPRGLSRPYTSFISSLCQGIHRAPLQVTNKTTKNNHTPRTNHNQKQSCSDEHMIGEQKQNHKKKILASTIQFSNNTNTTTHHQQHTPAAHHSIPPGTTHVIPDTQQRNKPSPQEPFPNHNQSHTTHTGLQTHNSSHSPAKKHKKQTP